MTEPAIRTVVIARAGAACDRLIEGLVESGADVAQAVDPTVAGPEAIEALAPDAIVVALDPVVEDVLETFEPLLLAPGRTVIFEEAALVLERTGWDAARWVRHLAAKLRGQGSVLPPGAEQDDEADAGPAAATAHAEAGGASTGTDVAADAPVDDADDRSAATFTIQGTDDAVPPADGADADTPVGLAVDPAAAGDAAATDVPTGAAPDDADGRDVAPSGSGVEGLTIEGLEDDFTSSAPVRSDDVPAAYAFDPVAAELDGASDAPAEIAPLVLDTDGADDAVGSAAEPSGLHFEGLTIEGLEDDFTSTASTVGDDAPVSYAFDPVAAEFDGAPSADDAAPVQVLDFEFELGDTDDIGYAPPVADAAAPAGFDTALTLDDGPARDGAVDRAVPASEPEVPHDLDASSRSVDASLGELDGSTLQLLDGDALPAAGDATASTRPASLDLAALESRISGLSLADTDSYGHGPRRGVVLVEGGLGGPDAVRQLLGAIPEGFPRPILVRLQLDGGRYDRLVRQMERATSLPVQLAEAGMSVAPGEVYFLPPGLLPATSGGALRFAEGGDLAALPEAVPAEDSAVLFLSGADVALVDIAMSPAWQGALVGGQSDEGCYDSVAAHAVAERGGPSGRPDEIADWLLARWMPAARQSEPGPGGLSL